MRLNLELTPAQIEICRDPHRVKIAICGRRWGKGCMDAAWLTEGAYLYPHSTSMYASLSYARAITARDMMYRELRGVGWRRISQFPPRLVAPNGSVVQFRSVDRPEKLLGEGIRRLVLDEICAIPERVWTEVTAPMLADTQGHALLTGTPVAGTWPERLFNRGRAGDPHIAAWCYPTRTGIRFQGSEGQRSLAELVATLDENTVRREFNCEWVAGSDAVFGSWVEACIAPDAPPTAPQHGWTYYAGLDIGRVRDQTTLVVVGWPPDGGPGLVCECHAWPLGLAHEVMALQANERIRRWRALCILDATGNVARGTKESYVALYEKAIPGTRPVVWGTNNKAEMISALKLGIERRALRIPAQFAALLRELRLYRYLVHTATNSIGYSAPAGEHDDHVAGLAMAYLGYRRNWGHPVDPRALNALWH
jgi:hypothetical protein